MSNLKLLSAGLIAAAMLATPAMARQHVRHVANDAYAYAPAAPAGRSCIPAPRVGAFASDPWTNQIPCEPGSGY
jgi:hypothetical protein